MDEHRVFGLPAEIGRWGFVLLGVAMNLCLGSVYAWSVFKGPVEKVLGCSATQGGLPFMAFLACFSLTMSLGGGLMERVGPRWLALAGGLVVGAGWLLSSLATDIWTLVATYGAVAGSGVGLAYGCPVALGARWFPDRKGLAVGLMLAGFGGSALVTAPVAGLLIGDARALAVAPLAEALSRTFLRFGLAFTAILAVLALPLRFPPPGWRPRGWTPAAGSVARESFDRAGMLRTASFRGLFACYCIGCLAGLMAIGISKNVANDVVHVSSQTGTVLVSLFALCNAAGRPLFGWLTDRLSPRLAAVLNLALILAASLAMLRAGPGTTGLYVAAFACFWLCLGGWLAIAPTATATFFGLDHYAKNYGTVFLAYGLGAILGNVVAGHAKDYFGSYTHAFVPTAVLAAVGIVLAAVFVGPPRPASPAGAR